MATEGEAISSQLRKGVVELAILALLHSGEAYGAEIVDRLDRHPALAISAGTAYPLLSRLKKAGLITSVWRESALGPPRKYYSLSPSGTRAYASMSTAWTAIRTDMDDLLETDSAHE